MEPIELDKLAPEQRKELLEQLLSIEKNNENKNRENYEAIRADVVNKIEVRVRLVAEDVKELLNFVEHETTAFYEIMCDYSQLRSEEQRSFQIQSGNFRIVVKNNKVKRFDERADVAAQRLIEFLDSWIKENGQGYQDPMYHLAMTLLERNKKGDLDYKSISKLYELESRFNNQEYSDIMTLFKEANIVETNCRNYYFFEQLKPGYWKKIEVSFNRM